MRKTKLFKRSAAVVLSSAMVISSVNAIPGTQKEASAAELTGKVIDEASCTAYYSFDNTLKNEVTGNNATMHGGAGDTWTKDTSGDTAVYGEGTKGKAVDLQGKSGDVNSDGLLLDTKINSDEFTLSFYTNMDAYTSASSLLFSAPNNSQGYETTEAGFNVAENWFGDSFPTIRVWQGATKDAWTKSDDFAADVYVDAFTKPELNKWVYLTITYGNGTLKLYRDGVLAGEKKDCAYILQNIKNCNLYMGVNFWDATVDGRIDELSIYNKALSDKQIANYYTGLDATKISDAISNASSIRSELYTKETADVFDEKYAAAKKVATADGATQDTIDAAADALTAAQAALVRKSENLTSDVLVNTDMTDKTSTIDKEAKTVTNDGYTMKAVGDSEIQDGYITGAKELYDESGKNGAVLDGSVLRNTTAEKGFTINAKLSIDEKSFYTVSGPDWSDVIGFYDSVDETDEATGVTTTKDIYKLRGTMGLAMMAPTAIFEWPNAVSNKSKDETISGEGGVPYNGFVWDSICQIAAGDKVVDYTITMNKDAFSIYLNGKLAMVYKNNDTNWLDVDSVIKYTDSITFMQTKDEDKVRKDLLGKLYGVQVYGRALNAAEVDTLISKGIDVSLNTITFKNQAADATISVKDANGTEVATAVCGTDGSAVVHGLTKGQTYTFTIKNGETWTREGSITVDADKVIDGWVATGVKFKEETLELKNSKIKATGEVKNDVKNLPALVLDPENTSEKIEDCKVSYASDKEEVAKVSEDGKVTAVADGEANITATVVTPSGNTLTAVCKVKVSTTEVTDVATAVKLDQETASIEIGKTLQLKAEVTPGTALQQGTWKSSNEAVAKVNEAGLVTAVAAGEAEITFTTADGTNLSAKCKVTVTAKAEPTAKPNATPAPGTSAKPAPGTSTQPTAKPNAKPTAKPTVAPTKKPSNTKKPAKKLKSATITVKNGKKKVSSVTVKTKKSVKLAVSVNSKAKLSVAKLSKKNAKIAKVTFKKNKLTIKGLKKGKVSIKITSKKTSKYKAATKTIKVTVKK